MFLKEDIVNSIVINKSEFITYLCRIKSEEEYRVKLAELKKKHYDATHVCSALITKDTVRSSDDGEPSGTAGVPILTVLQRNEMEETAAFVVRYFGGIKLGSGGLVRAYGGSVADTLKLAKKQIKKEMYTTLLEVDYETDNKIYYQLLKSVYSIDKEYDLNVKYTILSETDVTDKIIELTKNRYLSLKTLDKSEVFMDVVE